MVTKKLGRKVNEKEKNVKLDEVEKWRKKSIIYGRVETRFEGD